MVALVSVVLSASSPAFKCTGSEDICNVHDVDQYCGPSPGGNRRCIPCSHNKQSCGQSDMPLECYIYCIGIAVQLEIQKLKEMPCSQLVDVDHGEFNTSSHTHQTIGTVALIVCDVGYRLVGNPIIECLENGRWSSPSPVCKEITCADPGKLLNGYVIFDKSQDKDGIFRYNTSVGFGCKVGHTLQGDSAWQCQDGGLWNVVYYPVCTKGEDSTMMIIAVVFGCAFFAALFVIGILVYYLRKHHLEHKTCAPKPITRQVGENTDNDTEVTAQEGQQPKICEVEEVDETNQRDSIKHSSAIPLLPRPLPPSAPCDNRCVGNIDYDKTDVKNSYVKAETNVVITTECPAKTTDEVIKPQTTANGHSYLGTKEPAGTIIHANQVNLIQSNGDSARFSGHIGNGIDKRTPPKKARRELSHEDKEEVECLLPTEETGITKHAEQPEDHAEINDPKFAL